MWIDCNPNPKGKRVGDCAVRAVALALGIDWDTAYTILSAKGFDWKDMPNADGVWGAVLHDNKFTREAIANTCPDCYTAEDFCKDNKKGIYVLGFGGHVATVRDGNLCDTWDCSQNVPQFFWRKEK